MDIFSASGQHVGEVDDLGEAAQHAYDLGASHGWPLTVRSNDEVVAVIHRGGEVEEV